VKEKTYSRICGSTSSLAADDSEAGTAVEDISSIWPSLLSRVAAASAGKKVADIHMTVC
jgi:hypothetical protein